MTDHNQEPALQITFTHLVTFILHIILCELYMYFFMGNFMKLIRVVVRIIKININKRWVNQV